MSQVGLVSLCGLNQHDEVWIRSVIHMCLYQLDRTWEITSADVADVIICTPQSLSQWHQDVASEAIIVCLVHEQQQALSGSLVLHAPIRAAEFIQVLSRCDQLLSSRESMTYVPRPHRDSGGVDTPSSALETNLLVDEIHRQRQHHHFLNVSQDGRSWLQIDYLTERYIWLAADDERVPATVADSAVTWGEFCAVVGGVAQDWTFRSSQQRVCETAHPNWQPLQSLLWGLAYGPLAKHSLPVSDSKRYRLACWPDFGSLRPDATDLRLAAYASTRAYTIAELSRFAGVDQERVKGFLHACQCCRLVTEQRRQEEVVNDNNVIDLATHKASQSPLLRALDAIRQVFSGRY